MQPFFKICVYSACSNVSEIFSRVVRMAGGEGSTPKGKNIYTYAIDRYK